MLAKELIADVSADLQDVEHTRWSVEELLKYITSAQRQLVALRPDANAKVETVLLVAGSTRQEIPAHAIRFLGMVRNMGDGQTPGLPVTLTARSNLDDANNAWHTEAGSDTIDHFTFNEATPRHYYVTPPPADGVHVEIEYSETPTALGSDEDALALPEVWAEALREYVLYRTFSNNASDSAERSRAEWHLQKFYLALGEEQKAKLIFSPNRREAQGDG